MKLFVDKLVEIGAPVKRVWQVITEREYTDRLAVEFSPGMHKEWAEMSTNYE